MPRWIVAACLAGLGGCTAPGLLSCVKGTGAPAAIYTLYFGTSMPNRGDLTDREWRDFLDTTASAELPRGYTIFDAHGAWLNPLTQRTVNEASKVLVAALPEGQAGLAAVQRVRSSYQIKYHQKLVGMTVTHGCGDF